MEQLRIRQLIGCQIVALFTLALTACGGGGGGDIHTDDPVLAAACNYIGGAGCTTKGGEGGTIYIVDRLTDEFDRETGKAALGTLRYALEQGDTRVVLFRVSGTIHLSAPIEVTRGNLTIAGQTAPGDGICIADYPLIIKGCQDVIVRYIRVRLGNESLKKDQEKDYDAVSVNDCKNVVLDHVSASWSVDECVSCYGNENFTMQYCFITESLRNAGHVKGAHGYGGIWGGRNVTFHHNLLAHHDSRNPRFDHDYVDTKAGPIDYINNVVYNWGGNSTYGGEGSSNAGGGRKINHIANYYKAGPSTKDGVRERLMNPWASCDNCTHAHGGSVVAPVLYMTGNIVEGSTSVTADNWKGVSYSGGANQQMCKVDTRYSFPNAYMGEETADKALETVLTKAGCSFQRDALDTRIVSDVRNGNGKLIDKPSDVGGWPELKSLEPLMDTDRDGIPDEWELAHGLNPRSFKDHNEHTLVAAHTNLEAYLCDIVKHLY